METKHIEEHTLASLGIKPDVNSRQYNCPETTQQKLLNLSFYVCGFLDNIKTKFGNERFLIKIKFKKDDPDSEARKFFTNSPDIKYTMAQIKAMDAFPVKVTLRASGTRYYME